MPLLNALLDAWRRELGQALEMMTGQPYAVALGGQCGPPGGAVLWFVQRIKQSSGTLAVGAAEHVWNELGTRALQGAGLDLIETAEARNTWFEIAGQSLNGAAKAASTNSGVLELSSGSESATPPERSVLYLAQVTTPDGLSLELIFAANMGELNDAPDASRPIGTSAGQGPLQRSAHGAMDILLDVHLPISISFGHTQLRLKDLLKLTSGSVVELNRQPEEPVDVIVNNSVIARGEVVIVDGNYAVRIQEIVSRQQRLEVKDSPSGSSTRLT